MKTILSLLLLPMMVLAQPQSQQQEYLDIESSLDVAMASVERNEIGISENLYGTIEFATTIEAYVEKVAAYPQAYIFEKSETADHTLPQYLSTFSLVGMPTANKNRGPQDGLDDLLTLNDPQFQNDDTLVDWLNPVTYEQNTKGSAANIPEGFGPLIRL